MTPKGRVVFCFFNSTAMLWITFHVVERRYVILQGEGSGDLPSKQLQRSAVARWGIHRGVGWQITGQSKCANESRDAKDTSHTSAHCACIQRMRSSHVAFALEICLRVPHALDTASTSGEKNILMKFLISRLGLFLHPSTVASSCLWIRKTPYSATNSIALG